MSASDRLQVGSADRDGFAWVAWVTDEGIGPRVTRCRDCSNADQAFENEPGINGKNG